MAKLCSVLEDKPLFNAKFPLIITICVTIEIKSGSSSLTYRRGPFKDVGHAVDEIVLIVKKNLTVNPPPPELPRLIFIRGNGI